MQGTRIKRGLGSRIFFTLMACCLLGLVLTFIPSPSTPKAHAASMQAANCDDYTIAWSDVYDSYNHLEGTINLVDQDCSNGSESIWGEFIGNSNTWKEVTVYVEYSFQYGYISSGALPYISNVRYWAGSYSDISQCYYAEVDMLDNKGVSNWWSSGNGSANGQDCGN